MAYPIRWASAFVLALGALCALAVHGDANSPPATASVALSSDPLYAAPSGDKPALALALSVEYPTVGAQFVKGPDDVTDDSYSNEKEYLGYFDAESCYAYNDAPSEAPLAGQTRADYKRFQRQGPAARRSCSDAFSGNFMNWASGSAIDMLRLALSGGDRIVDTAELTVLQRAVIPDGDPMCMWNSTNFPAKRLQRNGGGGNAYWGAVPRAMVNAAAGSDIWVANTLERIYFGTARGGNCGNTGSYKLGGANFGNLNSDGFFYARVQVCNQDGAGALLDQRDYGEHPFCVRYPSGRYKPTGTIQQFSESLRLAAFGYALEQTASYNGGRYGGVLRAPMKYVGTETYDAYGQRNTPAGGNPVAEWDSATGVLHANPDRDNSQVPPISGVINYLNKFGRTGPVKGRYKRYDPVGELHYEALRYLQGLPPSPDAVARLSADMYDGFPIYTDWRALDPYAGRPADGNYACLRSNIVVIGDINTHDGGTDRWPAPGAAANLPDIGLWGQVVSAFEKADSARRYLDGQGVERSTSNPNAGNPTPPTDRIVGTAYWAHTHDVRGKAWTQAPDKQRPGLRVGTYVFDVNEYGRQSDSDTRHLRNQFFTAAKYGGFLSTQQASDAVPFNSWGNPFKNDQGADTNAVWEDPERPGEARNYFLQSDGRSVIAAFDKIFQHAGEASRNIAGAAVQSRHLTPGEGNVVYQGAFDTRNWTGDLLAQQLQVDASNQVSVASAPLWSAADRLGTRSAPRNIVIGKPRPGNGSAATPFSWEEMGDELKAQLNKPSETAVADGLGEDRVAWLRGDSSRERTLFRNRFDPLRGHPLLLGDIVNSGAVYSGAPAATTNSTAYEAFRRAHASRAAAVFVGANDGMLHAFHADSGDELFGYIPSWVAPGLPALTGKDYAARHRSYVDGTPIVAEALAGDTDVQANWKTVLVGASGAGGRGVFALDVSDPAAFDASKVLWEFTAADDASLGFVVGQPRILKFRTSAKSSAQPHYQWFAVVASGVNSQVPDGNGRFSDGRPSLFLLDLAKPVGTAWREGSNYYKIVFPFDAELAATRAPGLLNFNVALGARQEVAKLYAGDLHGRMWKLDFSANGTADWQLAKLSPFRSATSPAVPFPLFIARDARGVPQPVSAPPFLARGDQPNAVLVAFGTGKYLEAADRARNSHDSFYVIYDDGQAHADNANPAGAVPDKAQLQRGSFDAASGTVKVDAFAWGRRKNAQDTVSHPGWTFDFPGAGERLTSAIGSAGDSLVFSSLLPSDSSQDAACGAGSGGGRLYVSNIDDGSSRSFVSKVGLLGQGLVLNVDGATVESPTDSTGRRTRTVTHQTLIQGTGGVGTATTVSETQIAGRLSWRQIHNYQELRAAP